MSSTKQNENQPEVLVTVSWTREDLRKQFQECFQRDPSEEELDTCAKVLKKDDMRKAYIQTSRTFIFEALLQGIAAKTASIQGMPCWFSLEDRIVPLSERVRAVSPDLENIDSIFLYANCELVSPFDSINKMLTCLEKDGHTGWRAPTVNELSCLCGMQKELKIRPTEVWSGETYDTEQENIFGKKVPCKVRMTLNFDDGEVCRGEGFTHAAVILVHKEDKVDAEKTDSKELVL